MVRLFNEFATNVRRASTILIVRFIVAVILLLPVLIMYVIISFARAWRWRREKSHRRFLINNRLAFLDIDENSLKVTPIKGGLSNLNLVWSCRTHTGVVHKYFVKIFLPLGTFWARISSMFTPYPRVYGSRSVQRFTIDMVSRAQLAEAGVYVPRLVAFDPREKLLVTEYLEGEPVDHILRLIQERGHPNDEDYEVITQCGVGIGKAHAAGFSLVDLQPSNCMWIPGRKGVYFIDLEYCTREDLRAWDVGYFLISLTTLLAEPLAKEMKQTFLTGYRIHYEPDWMRVEETGRMLEVYLPLFRTILDIRKYSPEEVFAELFHLDSSADAPQD